MDIGSILVTTLFETLLRLDPEHLEAAQKDGAPVEMLGVLYTVGRLFHMYMEIGHKRGSKKAGEFLIEVLLAMGTASQHDLRGSDPASDQQFLSDLAGMLHGNVDTSELN